MAEDPEQLIQLAQHHFGRTAYHTRDNPYLRSRVASALEPDVRGVLKALLGGDLDPEAWLQTEEGSRSVEAIQVGVVPRDLQLILRDGREQVGVESVHAFVRAPLFWWLVSVLWCAEVGRAVDVLLGENVMGYRLHPQFVSKPARSARMFRSASNAHAQWRQSATRMAAKHRGQVIATSTVDLRDFYYSVAASPSTIVEAFIDGTDSSSPLTDVGWALTRLLDAAHSRYAKEDERVKPRGDIASAGMSPLPVGLPSSQVLANLVVGVALRHIASLPTVMGVSAYADDLLVLSPLLPEVDEGTFDYFARLEIVKGTADEPVVASGRARQLATFIVGVDKSETSYSRVGVEEAGEESRSLAADDIDPYVAGRPGSDWGGRLRTVLRAPFKRDRVPRELAKEILRITDEIRVGIERSDADKSVTKLMEDMDQGSFLALRPFWTELIASSWFAGGVEALNGLGRLLNDAVGALEPPAKAREDLRVAIDSGLRDSWGQALAEALAAATGGRRLVITQLDQELLVQATGMTSKSLAVRVQRLRDERFVPALLVSMPLSEFTAWRGGLFGVPAFQRFARWVEAASTHGADSPSVEGIGGAKRFVPLHEVCVAIHLWIAPHGRRWRPRAFEIFRAQPLLDKRVVTDLVKKSRRILRVGNARHEATGRLADYTLRFAIPSMEISGEQLTAILAGNRALSSAIARKSRTNVQRIVRDAARRHADVLVLPEWALINRQLPWLFDQSAKNQILIVGGEAPAVRGGIYSNRVWTGLPLIDSAGHRACLVPPPREKRYLSPTEAGKISAAGVPPSAKTSKVPVFNWRGVNLASLICFEFADIHARDALRASADLLTVSSWNMDWRYFDAVQEATTRDNYCVTVCVNTSQFPGTRIMRPTKSEKAVAASVHGSGDPTVVTRVIDLLPVVVSRSRSIRPSARCGFLEPSDDVALADYKALPPTL